MLTRLWRHNFKINLMFLIKPVFFTWTKSQDKKLKILKTKRAFKIIHFFIDYTLYIFHNFKRTFIEANKTILFGSESPTLIFLLLKQKLLMILLLFIKKHKAMEFLRLNKWVYAHLRRIQNPIKYLRWSFLARKKLHDRSLREKCPNTEFFLVRIFPHSD